MEVYLSSCHETLTFRVRFLLLFPYISVPPFLQTLCILANIADGTTAKEFIMTNDDILQKIKYYMVCNLNFSIIKFWKKIIAQGFSAFGRNLYIKYSSLFL